MQFCVKKTQPSLRRLDIALAASKGAVPRSLFSITCMMDVLYTAWLWKFVPQWRHFAMALDVSSVFTCTCCAGTCAQ